MAETATQVSADKVEDEVMNTLPTLYAKELMEICDLIGVTGIKDEEKGNKRVLLKLVMKSLCTTTDDNDKLTEFLQIHKYLKLDEEDSDADDDKAKVASITPEIKTEKVVPKSSDGSDSSGGRRVLARKNRDETISVTRTIRKDFKLSGMIGG